MFVCGCLGSKFVHLCLKMLELENFRKPFRIAVEVCNHRVTLLHHMILRIKRNYRMVPFKMLFILIFRIWLPIYIYIYQSFIQIHQASQWFAPFFLQALGTDASGTGLRLTRGFVRELRVVWGLGTAHGTIHPIESMGNYVSRQEVHEPLPDSGPRNNEHIILNMKHGKITSHSQGMIVKPNATTKGGLKLPESLEPD